MSGEEGLPWPAIERTMMEMRAMLSSGAVPVRRRRLIRKALGQLEEARTRPMSKDEGVRLVRTTGILAIWKGMAAIVDGAGAGAG